MKQNPGEESGDELKWPGKQILIIEDDIQDFIALEGILKDRLKIHFLNSPEQAIEYCSKNSDIDLCLMGFTEHKDDGLFEQLISMRESYPLIAMLPSTLNARQKSAVRKQFTDVVLKPFRKNEILSILDKYLA